MYSDCIPVAEERPAISMYKSLQSTFRGPQYCRWQYDLSSFV